MAYFYCTPLCLVLRERNGKYKLKASSTVKLSLQAHSLGTALLNILHLDPSSQFCLDFGSLKLCSRFFPVYKFRVIIRSLDKNTIIVSHMVQSRGFYGEDDSEAICAVGSMFFELWPHWPRKHSDATDPY